MNDGIDWPDEGDTGTGNATGTVAGTGAIAEAVRDTPLVTNVELDADGRQHGFVALPGRAGTLDRPRLPLTVLRRGSGPRFVLIGGADGERSGSLALHRLARELEPADVGGTVVIVPEAPRDALGWLAGELTRTPDEASGPVTLLELAGAPPGFGFSPMAALALGSAADVEARAEATMIAFGAPESVRFAAGLLPGTAVDATIAGRVAHVVATPGGGVPAADALDIALVGCRNALAAAGVLAAPLALRSTRTLRVRGAEAFVHAPLDGLLELRVHPGQNVYRGNPLALVVEPTRTGIEPFVVRVPRDGVALGVRGDARVRAGDCLAVIADETAR